MKTFCQECEGRRTDCDRCDGIGLNRETLTWLSKAEREIKRPQMDTDPRLAFHTIELGFHEVYRRWPAQTLEQRRDYGFNPLASTDAGWQNIYDGRTIRVQKQLACSGADSCPLCNNDLPADCIP